MHIGISGTHTGADSQHKKRRNAANDTNLQDSAMSEIIRFTPKSGHQNWPAFSWRNSSGSLATLAAIRRASSLLSNVATDRWLF
jgi:hypothetical protein